MSHGLTRLIERKTRVAKNSRTSLKAMATINRPKPTRMDSPTSLNKRTNSNKPTEATPSHNAASNKMAETLAMTNSETTMEVVIMGMEAETTTAVTAHLAEMAGTMGTAMAAMTTQSHNSPNPSSSLHKGNNKINRQQINAGVLR